MAEIISGKDPYEGHSPPQLKADFWELCHMLPEPVADEDVQQAQEDFRKRIKILEADESIDNIPPLDNILEHRSRARSKLRRILTGRVVLWSTHVPITPTYGRFIAERRFGTHFHWGMDRSRFLSPKYFPAYLVGLEDDQENLGICDPDKSPGIESADYQELVKDHAYEWKQAIAAFGQDAMDRLLERISIGESPEHLTTMLIRNWRNDFRERYAGREP